MSVAPREGRLDRDVKCLGVQRRQLGDEGEIDQILGAGTRSTVLINTRVGVELLGDLELERDGLYLDWRDLCKGEESFGGEGVSGDLLIAAEAGRRAGKSRTGGPPGTRLSGTGGCHPDDLRVR
jgi:hypothetical protein